MQQPQLRRQRASVEAARGRVDLARVPLRPTVALSATAAVGSTRVVCDMNDVCTGGFLGPTASTGLAKSSAAGLAAAILYNEVAAR